MQDYIIAGLVFVLFVVFLFKTRSFASVLSPGPSPAPGPCTPAPVPSDRTCQTNNAGVPHTTTNACPQSYPNAVPTGCNNQNYCCQ